MASTKKRKFANLSCRIADAVILIIDFHHHVEDCIAAVIHRHTEIWIFECHHYAEGCCNGAVMPPHVGTWIFGFLYHAEGYCDGVVPYFVATLPPCAVICFRLTRGPGERPDAFLHVDRQVLVVLLISKPVLLEALLLVFSA
jgi:hypothetical protein